MKYHNVQTRIRLNGFERPWADEQIGTWILFPLVIGHYCLFLQPLLWSKLSINVPILTVFGLATITSGFGVYSVCTLNPSDRHLLDDAENNKDLLDIKQSLLVYCYICDKTVFKSSKHCKFCNKCVETFDHHCKWLNTCVGRANYRYFLLIVVGITIMTSLSIALSLAYVIESFAFTNEMKVRITGSYIPMNILGVQIVSVISTVIFSPIVCLVLQLAGFHIRLLLNNMTTYEFIVNESKKRKLVREKKKVGKRKKSENEDKDIPTSNELVGNKDEVDTESMEL